MSTSILEMPQLPRTIEQPSMTSSHESEQPRVSLGFSPFTAAEMESFQNNDSMAAGMIATILGLAFLVLLGLVITVSVWTLNSTV